MRRHTALGLALVATLALGACGGGDEGGDAAGGGEASASTLSMVDNAFEPASLSVSAGTALEVTNDGEALHNVTVEGTDIDEDVDAGGSTSVTVDLEAGDYTMFCEYHRGAGMEGTLTVS